MSVKAYVTVIHDVYGPGKIMKEKYEVGDQMTGNSVALETIQHTLNEAVANQAIAFDKGSSKTVLLTKADGGVTIIPWENVKQLSTTFEED